MTIFRSSESASRRAPKPVGTMPQLFEMLDLLVPESDEMKNGAKSLKTNGETKRRLSH
jgi:hypothetical protein